MARRHRLTYGTTPEQLATVAAVIRTNGHANRDAVYYGRGPFSPGDILASRMIADPFHLLDCATTSEGGCAIVLAKAERAAECAAPVWILRGASDSFGPAYVVAPVWDFQSRDDSTPAGLVGARALLYQRCAECSSRGLSAFTVCAQCHATSPVREVSAGKGSLYSWTVVWRPPDPSFRVPYAPAVVRLDKGFWMMSAVIGCEPDALHEGLRLAVLRMR